MQPVQSTIQSYQDFAMAKASLLDTLDVIESSARDIGISQTTESNIERVCHSITEDVFRVVFVGGFSRGKSTTVNALLGANVLPAKLTPTTAVITTVQYGDIPQATVHFKKDQQRNAVTIPIDQLNQYAVIPRNGYAADTFRGRIDTLIERIVLEYPTELCKNGVELVDSPGLEDDDTRQEITLRYLNQADAAVVLLSCQQLLTMDEKKFIKEEVLGRGFEHVFYVINFCDGLNSAEDEQDIRLRAQQHLGDSPRVFMLSSRAALQAKLSGSLPLGVPQPFREFESSLEKFLAEERGNVKISASARLIEGITEEVERLVQVKLNMLRTGTKENLDRIREQFEARKKAIMDRKEQLLQEVGVRSARIGDRTMASFVTKCHETRAGLQTLVNQDDDTGLLDLVVHSRRYEEEVAAIYRAYIYSSFGEWAQKDVPLIVDQEVSGLREMVDRELQVLLRDVDSLNMLLDPDFQLTSYAQDRGLERVLAAAGGLLLGDFGTVITGGVLGVAGALKQLGMVVAANAGLWFLGLLNPVTALLASLATTGVTLAGGGKDLKRRIRAKIADSVSDAIDRFPEEKQREIRSSVFALANQIGKTLNNGLDGMVSNLELQLSLAEHEAIENRDTAIAHYEMISERLSQAHDVLSSLSTLSIDAGISGYEC